MSAEEQADALRARLAAVRPGDDEAVLQVAADLLQCADTPSGTGACSDAADATWQAHTVLLAVVQREVVLRKVASLLVDSVQAGRPVELQRALSHVVRTSAAGLPHGLRCTLMSHGLAQALSGVSMQAAADVCDAVAVCVGGSPDIADAAAGDAAADSLVTLLQAHPGTAAPHLLPAVLHAAAQLLLSKRCSDDFAQRGGYALFLDTLCSGGSPAPLGPAGTAHAAHLLHTACAHGGFVVTVALPKFAHTCLRMLALPDAGAVFHTLRCLLLLLQAEVDAAEAQQHQGGGAAAAPALLGVIATHELLPNVLPLLEVPRCIAEDVQLRHVAHQALLLVGRCLPPESSVLQSTLSASEQLLGEVFVEAVLSYLCLATASSALYAQAEQERLVPGGPQRATDILAAAFHCLRRAAPCRRLAQAMCDAWGGDGLAAVASHYLLHGDAGQHPRSLTLDAQSVLHHCHAASSVALQERLAAAGYLTLHQLLDRRLVSAEEEQHIVCADAADLKELHAAAQRIQKVWRGRQQRRDYTAQQQAKCERQLVEFDADHTAAQEALLQKEFDMRELIHSLAKRELHVQREYESLRAAGVSAATSELKQRLTIRRQMLLARQADTRDQLTAQHKEKMKGLVSTQAEELELIRNELGDVKLLPLTEDTLGRADAIAKREDRLKQQHARSRLYLRGVFMEELEGVAAHHEEELRGLDDQAHRLRDFFLLQIAEEKSRGAGLAGRTWWANTGIERDEFLEWRPLRIAMELQWTQGYGVAVCQDMYVHEAAVRHALLQQEVSAQAAIRHAALAFAEGTEWLDLQVQHTVTSCTSEADAALAGLLHREHAARFSRLFAALQRGAAQATGECTAEEDIAACLMHHAFGMQRHGIDAAARAEADGAWYATGRTGVLLFEESRRLELQVGFAECVRRHVDAELAHEEEVQRRLLLEYEGCARLAIEQERGYDLTARDQRKVRELFYQREAAKRETIEASSEDAFDKLLGCVQGAAETLLVAREAQVRKEVGVDESRGRASIVAELRLLVCLDSEAERRQCIDADGSGRFVDIVQQFAKSCTNLHRVMQCARLAADETDARSQLQAACSSEGCDLRATWAPLQHAAASRRDCRLLAEEETDVRHGISANEASDLHALSETYSHATLLSWSQVLLRMHEARSPSQEEVVGRMYLEAVLTSLQLRTQHQVLLQLMRVDIQDGHTAVCAVMTDALVQDEAARRQSLLDTEDLAWVKLATRLRTEVRDLNSGYDREALVEMEFQPRLCIEAIEAAAWVDLLGRCHDEEPVMQSFVAEAMREGAALRHRLLGEHHSLLLDVCAEEAACGQADLSADEVGGRLTLEGVATLSCHAVQRSDMAAEEDAYRGVVEAEEEGVRDDVVLLQKASQNDVCTFLASVMIQKHFRGHRARQAVAVLRGRRVAQSRRFSRECAAQEVAYSRQRYIEGFALILQAKTRVATMRRARSERFSVATCVSVAVCAAAACVRVHFLRTSLLTLQRALPCMRSKLVFLTRYNSLQRRLEIKNAERTTSAVAIQQWYASRLQRRAYAQDCRVVREAALRRKQLVREAAACCLSRCSRGCAARQEMSEVRRVHRLRCVVTVQQCARFVLAVEARGMQQLVCVAQRVSALQGLVSVQAVLRAQLSRRVAYWKRCDAAAHVLQRAVRRLAATNRVQERRQVKASGQQQTLQHTSATVIQTVFRGHLARKRVTRHRRVLKHKEFQQWEERCRSAARHISDVHRGCLARTHLWGVWTESCLKIQVIQRGWRCHAARCVLLQKRDERMRAELRRCRQLAGAALQRLAKGVAVRVALAHTKHTRDALLRQQCVAVDSLKIVGRAYVGRRNLACFHAASHRAATAIQCCWRTACARRETQLRRSQNEVALRVLQVHTAAARIQAAYRKHYRRRRAAAYRLQRYFARVLPHIAVAREMLLQRRRLRRLALRKVERITETRSILEREELQERGATRSCYALGELFPAFIATHTTRVRQDIDTPADHTPPPEAQPNAIAVRRLEAEEKMRRRLVVAETVRLLEQLYAAQRQAYTTDYNTWVLRHVGRVLQAFLREEASARKVVATQQLAERRALKLRLNRLLRFQKARPPVAQQPASRVSSAASRAPLPPLRQHPTQTRCGSAGSAGSTRAHDPYTIHESADLSAIVPEAVLTQPKQRVPSPGLRRRGSLQCIDASGKHLGDARCVEILERLETCGDNVLSLRLDRTGLGNEGAEALGRFLRHNRSVTSISLANNPALTDSGARHLVAALKGNPCLRFIDTDNTSLTPATKQMLGYLLTSNATSPAKLVSSSRPVSGSRRPYLAKQMAV